MQNVVWTANIKTIADSVLKSFIWNQKIIPLEKEHIIEKNDIPREKPGGLKRPNDFGLYDMHGNKSEFVLDAYTYYNDPSIIADPKGVVPETFPPKRTLRGGGTYNSAELMMSGMTFDSEETTYAGHRFVCPALAK